MPKILSLWWTPLLLSLTLACNAQGQAQVVRATAADSTSVDSTTAVDAAWILHNIAQPLPARSPFIEMRSSAMLKAPLRIAGEYRRPDAGTLVREVREPYAETTTIAGGKASISRDGRAAKTFSLSRAPELASLQQGFGSMLAGDRATLEEHYRLEASGTREHWSLLMKPKDAAAAKRVSSITLYGKGAELRCIETARSKGNEMQRTLLGSGANDAANVQTEQALAALCHGDITP